MKIDEDDGIHIDGLMYAASSGGDVSPRDMIHDLVKLRSFEVEGMFLRLTPST